MTAKWLFGLLYIAAVVVFAKKLVRVNNPKEVGIPWLVYQSLTLPLVYPIERILCCLGLADWYFGKDEKEKEDAKP